MKMDHVRPMSLERFLKCSDDIARTDAPKSHWGKTIRNSLDHSVGQSRRQLYEAIIEVGDLDPRAKPVISNIANDSRDSAVRGRLRPNQEYTNSILGLSHDHKSSREENHLSIANSVSKNKKVIA
jgi:hypothetical protein